MDMREPFVAPRRGEIGTLRRHIGLPLSMAGLTPARAKLDNKVLTVEMKETPS